MRRKSLYVRSIVLKGLPEFIEKLGGNSKALFLRAGLSPVDLRQGNTLISWLKACTLLELAATELNEPQFGIKWACEIPDDFQNSGPMIFLLSLVPDIRSFIKLAEKYHKIHTNGVTSETVDDPEAGLVTHSVYMHSMTPACRQYSEHIMAVTARIAHKVFDDMQFSTVCFQHNAPADISWHKKVFQCPIIFNHTKMEISCDKVYFDRNIGSSMSFLQPMLKLYLDRQARKLPISDTPVTDNIMEILPSIFGTMRSTPNAVAQVLNMSPKKLQRLLKEEDTHFSDIRDKVRHEIASRLLIESDLTIIRLAALLDYSSPEAFNTACKRWFEVSPREYRKNNREHRI